MSWAEFVLRSIGFKEQRKHNTGLVRILAYESHKIQYLFGKTKPPSIEKYWPLDGKIKTVLTAEQREAFAIADKKAQEQKKVNEEKNG